MSEQIGDEIMRHRKELERLLNRMLVCPARGFLALALDAMWRAAAELEEGRKRVKQEQGERQ